jgi:hypothetical protein
MGRAIVVTAQAAKVVATEQAHFDVNMEASLLVERARWDDVGHAEGGWTVIVTATGSRSCSSIGPNAAAPRRGTATHRLSARFGARICRPTVPALSATPAASSVTSRHLRPNKG